MQVRNWIGMVMSLTLVLGAMERLVGRAPGRKKPLTNRTITMCRPTAARW